MIKWDFCSSFKSRTARSNRSKSNFGRIDLYLCGSLQCRNRNIMLACTFLCPILVASADSDSEDVSKRMDHFRKWQSSHTFRISVDLNWFWFRSALQNMKSKKFMLMTGVNGFNCSPTQTRSNLDSFHHESFSGVISLVLPSSDIFVYGPNTLPTEAANLNSLRLEIIELYPKNTEKIIHCVPISVLLLRSFVLGACQVSVFFFLTWEMDDDDLSYK